MQRFTLIVSICLLNSSVQSADWPMERHDAQRSGTTTQQLSDSLHLQWSHQLPKLTPAWLDQPKVQTDAIYHPIVMGNRMFVGSSWDDTMTAFDTETGKELWRFYAEGPIRFAPVAWKDRVIFGCDDGYLYCVSATEGKLLWKLRGGPSDQRLLGNGRLISAWPVRGAPVLVNDTVYFAAGIWPFMGTFIYAVNAETGEVIWTNDGDGSMFIKQPHNAEAFAGVAPQGAFVVVGDRLLVPGGRSVPACYDRRTGKFMYYKLAQNGKRGGGANVSATEKWIFNGAAVFELDTEDYLTSVGKPVMFTKERLYAISGSTVKEMDLSTAAIKKVVTKDRKGKKTTKMEWTIKTLGNVNAKGVNCILRAGQRLYVGKSGAIEAYQLPLTKSAKPVWQRKIVGDIRELLAADDRLFAVTLDGHIHCFGERQSVGGVESTQRVTRKMHGYAILHCVDNAKYIERLSREGDYHWIVLESDEKKAYAMRDKLRRQYIPASQMAIHLYNDENRFTLPQYLASQIIDDHPEPDVKTWFRSLRPYGGKATFFIPPDQQQAFRERVAKAKLANAEIQIDGQQVHVIRKGALPGSDNWTHEHADAANTRVSNDQIVKAPLGVLWFGGSTNTAVLPRHGHGPQPQVVDGRLFIEGVDMLRAMDIYTGRILWERKLPGVGAFFNNTAHQPGANASGTNFVSMSDGIYVAYENSCLMLDPATGKTLKKFHLPSLDGDTAPRWGFLSVAGDYLLGGAEPFIPPKEVKKGEKDTEEGSGFKATLNRLLKKVKKETNDAFTSSRELTVMDRHTGKVLWKSRARHGFRHNAICVGGNRVYCIDRVSGPQLARLSRRGQKPKLPPRLVVFDLKTGKQLWETDKNIFGTWLSYSVKHDLLIEAGRVARDTVIDEAKGMRAYQAKSGKILWHEKDYKGPAMIHGKTILMAGSACDLLTGKAKMRPDPLTGELIEWKWTRTYGCNTPAASTHLLTFRSGAAGYYDLCNDSGTGNFGGFRSSCTNNLIVAGGLLNAPDYTRTCVCSYQNQTSLALVHMPQVEMWTFFGSSKSTQAVKRAGINFGAPGDRKSSADTLWLEYPSLAGRSPTVPIKITPAKPQTIRRHSSQISGEELPWVCASAIQGVQKISLTLNKDAKKTSHYWVRLYFAELEDVQAGERVMDVSIQGDKKLTDFDISTAAKGVRRAIVKEWRSVSVKDTLTIELKSKNRPTLLSGIEVIKESN